MVFPLIDLARGFAALSVLVYHFLGHWQWDAFPQSGPLQWFRSGWMSVDLFFVISGFVIGLSAFSRIDGHGHAFRAGFLRSRLARIVPLHYVTLLAFVLLVQPALRSQPGFWPDLLAHLAFVHNLFLPYFGSVNGPNWSLGTEMQFYLLIALAAPWLRTARPWLFVCLFFAIAWTWRFAAWSLTIPGSFDTAYYAQSQLPGMLDAFAIGLLLARFVRTPRGQAFLARLAACAMRRYALLALAGLCWWASFEIFLTHHFWHEAAMATFFRTAVAACGGLAVLLLCAWPMPKARMLLALPLYLGKVSYGIYLWHLPVLILLARHTQLAPLTALSIAVIATVGLAALSWHCIERPVLRRQKNGRIAAAGIANRAERLQGDAEPLQDRHFAGTVRSTHADPSVIARS
jgi:peptidoglycan/LPS O-acetylase OafA/YrhL